MGPGTCPHIPVGTPWSPPQKPGLDVPNITGQILGEPRETGAAARGTCWNTIGRGMLGGCCSPLGPSVGVSHGIRGYLPPALPPGSTGDVGGACSGPPLSSALSRPRSGQAGLLSLCPHGKPQGPPRVSSLNFVLTLAALLSSLGCSSARVKLTGSFSPSCWDFPV